MVGITKRFGGLVACDHVDLAVARGEIHGLLGQNGAGKSTLMKILTGILMPDAGSTIVDGTIAHITDPRVAASMGIAMVHQHFSVIEALTVWENVKLGERTHLDRSESISVVESISQRYGLDVDPCAHVADLTAGQRQRVEIVKCLRRDPQILVLDEPTSVLTLAESEELFEVLRHVVKAERRAVVLISHKLDEILQATDRVTIMRDGAVVASLTTSSTNAHTLAREMVGREVSLRGEAAALGLLAVAEAESSENSSAVSLESQRVVLRISDATLRRSDGRVLLDRLNLELHEGEILGIAGVEGNGQSNIADLLHSLVTLDEGSVEVDGVEVRTGRAGAMANAGVAVIPEDRHVAGCVLDMSVADNLVLGDIDVMCRGPFLSRAAIREHATELISRFEIRPESPDAPMRSLSGGNQQRVVLARGLSRRPKVLVAAQPTRGLDVGAVEFMSENLRSVANAGVAVLLISTELEEILALSDRVAVICRGRIMGVLPRGEIDLDQIGMMMGGKEL